MGKRNNSQRKENVESPRKEISENEACNMTEKEFRVMVMEFIHRMDEKINNLCKNQEEMKSDIATIKNTMESFNSRLQEAEDRISELEDQVQKQAQAEQQLEKKIKKQEESLRELRDNMKRSNMRIIGLPEGQEEQQGLENLFEEIMTENFPDMGKIKVTQETEKLTPGKEHKPSTYLEELQHLYPMVWAENKPSRLASHQAPVVVQLQATTTPARPLNWTKVEQQAFEELKKALSLGPGEAACPWVRVQLDPGSG
ncbi:hypothetical protein QTO34_000598 [Cnephaeus nilssonii]|uniref:L1 transposable element RRM domain-containing protein n=1 Tax=Cnephaeus nilssonii TaxID=3371016 RepID=A0AA40LWQ6_CNENI|nr:hypothetical protein QTO34_000598 [Eptesicus nilssonii]